MWRVVCVCQNDLKEMEAGLARMEYDRGNCRECLFDYLWTIPSLNEQAYA